MTTLLIMRHGKAEAHRRDDFTRELSRKGRDRTRSVAGRLPPAYAPDLIISSPAPRARQTAAIFAEAQGLAERCIIEDRELYDLSTPEELMRIVRRHAADASRLAVVGHNPGLSWLASWLCAEVGPGLITSELLVVDLDDLDWNVVGAGDGRLTRRLSPKD